MTPLQSDHLQHFHQSFSCRPAEQVAPNLIACLLVKRISSGELFWLS